MIMVEICLWLMFSNTKSAILYCLAVLKAAAASDDELHFQNPGFN